MKLLLIRFFQYVYAAITDKSYETGRLGLLFVLLFLIFSILLPGQFLHITTFQSMMYQIPELGFLSLAMALPLISGGINLSIIATANISALLMAYIMQITIPDGAVGAEVFKGIAMALFAGLFLCLLIGWITGYMVATIRAHPILITLGTMSLISGLGIYLTHGMTISGMPDSFLWIANDTIAHIPVSFLLFIIVALIVHFFLVNTSLGIEIYMTGSSPGSTRFSGVNVKRALIRVYILSSLLCWFASIIMLARFNSASMNYAQSYLLITILVAILGGIDPFGGFGRITGLILALGILQLISSGFNLLGFDQNITIAIWGGILVLVLAMRMRFVARHS